MKLTSKVLIITALLLTTYYFVVRGLGVEPSFAESNYMANKIRLQSLDSDEKELNAVITGSSIAARLYPSLIKGEKPSLNLSLDGSRALFGVEQLFASGKKVDTLIIEMNTILLDTTNNDKSLREGQDSGTEKLSRHFPLVKAKMRPVTIAYSKLKEYKDSKLKVSLNADDFRHLIIEQYALNGMLPEVDLDEKEQLAQKEFEAILVTCKKKNIRVIMLMVPDGGQVHPKALKADEFAMAMALKHDVAYLNLKKHFMGDELTYTDGLHMSVPSAKFISQVISNALSEK